MTCCCSYLHVDSVGCPALHQNLSRDGVKTIIENGIAKFQCWKAKHYDLVGPTNKSCDETTGKWTPEGLRYRMHITLLQRDVLTSIDILFLQEPVCVSPLTGLRHPVGETITKQKDCRVIAVPDTTIDRPVTSHICQANWTWQPPLVDHCRCSCSYPATEIGDAELVIIRTKRRRCVREGTTAFYRCEKGNGGILVCRGGDWQWRGSAPTCEPKRDNRKKGNAVHLPSGVVIKSLGDVRKAVFSKGEAILLDCGKRGQKLRGSESAVCTRNGWKYDTREPRCVKVRRNKTGS